MLTSAMNATHKPKMDSSCTAAAFALEVAEDDAVVIALAVSKGIVDLVADGV